MLVAKEAQIQQGEMLVTALSYLEKEKTGEKGVP